VSHRQRRWFTLTELSHHPHTTLDLDLDVDLDVDFDCGLIIIEFAKVHI
jgi:hypothetical protein